jgi:hypothetical protein
MFILLILVNFLAPGSGSAFPRLTRIPESHINADLDPKHWKNIATDTPGEPHQCGSGSETLEKHCYG